MQSLCLRLDYTDLETKARRQGDVFSERVLTGQAFPVSLNLSPMRFLFLICFLNENILHSNNDSLLFCSFTFFLYESTSFDKFCQKKKQGGELMEHFHRCLKDTRNQGNHLKLWIFMCPQYSFLELVQICICEAL